MKGVLGGAVSPGADFANAILKEDVPILIRFCLGAFALVRLKQLALSVGGKSGW